MDPNITLQQIREINAKLGRTKADLEELSALIQVLDEWMSRGGFLPDDWRAHHNHGRDHEWWDEISTGEIAAVPHTQDLDDGDDNLHD